MLLRPKTGLKDMVAELTPGTQRGRRARGRPADPGRPDAARRQPRRDPRRARRRHARLPAAAARPAARRALARQRARAGEHDPALRADRARHARDHRAARRRGARTSGASSTTSRWSSRSSAARTTSSPSSSRTPTPSSPRSPARTRTCARRCRSCRRRCARRKTALGKAEALADELGPDAPGAAAGRARARADAAPDAPVPARDDADHPGRDPPVRARRAPARERAAAGDARPRRRSRPTCCARFKVLNALLNTLAYNPPGDTEEGYLFWASWVNHLGPAIFSTQDAHGPIRRGLVVVGCQSLQVLENIVLGNPQLGVLDAAARGARPRRRSARRAPQAAGDAGGPADAEGRPQLRPDRRDGRLRAVVLRRWCCSCGWRSAARSRSSRRATASARRSPRPRSWPPRPTCGSPACRSARSRRSSPTPDRPLAGRRSSSTPKYAPLPSDAQAMLRQKTLLGETYVELTPGTERAEKLPEGGRLAAGQVSRDGRARRDPAHVRPETRAAFQEWMQTQAQAIAGRGRDLNDALGNLGPFAEDAAELVDILNRQEPAVRAPGLRHRRGVRGADRARRAAARR